MKRFAVAVLGLWGIFIFASCTKTEENYYPSGKIRSVIHYRGGMESGKSLYYYEFPNTLEIEIEMKKGKRNGEFNRYYENGQLDTHCTYVNDSIEGIETMYTANGRKSQQYTYLHGKKNGPHTAYHLSGDVKIQGSFKNDMFDGDWHYYDERGVPVGDGHFDCGTGSVSFYDPEGRLARTTFYVDNKKDGKETYYTPSGSIYKEIIFEQDRIVSIKTDSLLQHFQ